MLHIYTDGSCINNGKANAIASWSYVVLDDNNNVIEMSTGRVPGKQDNNRAELTAFLKALRYIRTQRQEEYIIYVDFEAIYLYYYGKTRPKANKDLYKEIEYILRICTEQIVCVKKVKSHQTRFDIVHFFNGLVDKIAQKSIELFCLQK